MLVHLVSLGRVSYAEGLRAPGAGGCGAEGGRDRRHAAAAGAPAGADAGPQREREHVLASEEFLQARGVEVHEINRGGDVTYHGPGQLVGYPIVDLRGDLPGKRGPHLGPVDFVRLLEEVLIRTCGDFRVMTERVKGCTGVWTAVHGAVPAKKVAAIGVHVSQGVTSHGFALNVTTDLRDFEWIVPCGISTKGVTSLEVESPAERTPTMDAAMNATAKNFGRIFGRQMLYAESLDQLLAGSAQVSYNRPAQSQP